MNSPIYIFTWVTALCVIGLLWSLGIKKLILDRLRERLFELRFQLYAMAMEGDLACNDPAYRISETLICGLVRFAHRITFLTYVFSLRQYMQTMKEKNHVDVSKQLALSVSKLEPDVQAKLNEILQNARTAVMLYMVFSSVTLFTAMMAFSIARGLGLNSSGNTKEQQFSTPIEQEAYRFETKRQNLKLVAA